jgi:hypothetical protein
MKKFTLILIVVAAIFVGITMFHIGFFLLKVFAGLFVAFLVGSGSYLGYLIGSKLSKKRI